MRICHVASHDGVFRGGAVQLCRMAIAQKQAGHDVFVIAYERRRRLGNKKDRDRATWKSLTDAGVVIAFLDYFRFSDKFRMRRLLSEWNIEVVHAHRDEALVATAHALIGTSRPALIAQRGTTSIPPSHVARILRSSKVRAIVAVASAVKRTLVEKVGVKSEKIHVVYGSVNLDKFSPREKDPEILAQLELSADAPIIGSLSAYRKAKGLERLVRALKQPLESHPTAHAVFIGKKIPKKLSRQFKDVPIPHQLHFLPHQDEVTRWLSVMDLTIVAATEREGLSGVLRESLAMGIPVISTDCSGNGEIVQDRRTGLLVPAGDRQALSDAIQWALDHPAEMKQMAEAGRQWVIENCAPEVHTARLLRVYQTVLQ